MKQLQLFTLLAALCIAMSVSAEKREVTDTTGVHPITQDTHAALRSGWTLYLQGGISLFDGDIAPALGNNLAPRTGAKPHVGIGAEYAITPVWNIGAQYNWYQYGGVEEKNPNNWVRGNAHAFDMYLSADLIDVFMPNRKRELFSLLPAIGAGFETYDATSHRDLTPEENKYVQIVYPNKKDALDGDGYQGFGDNFIPVIPMSVTAAFNINRAWALALKAEYRTHIGRKGDMMDNFDKGKEYDGTLNLLAQVRYKFNAWDKDHKFNMLPESSAGAAALATAAMAAAKKANDRLDDVEPALDSLEARVDSIQDYVMGPDDDHDGVPNSRDLEPNTDKEAVYVDFWGRGHKAQDHATDILPPTIYFSTGSAVITATSDYEIRKVVTALMQDPTRRVEVRAYCDAVSDDEFNRKLAIRRAESSKKQLMSYGISEDRIILNPHGRIKEPATACAANRRVEFHYDK